MEVLDFSDMGISVEDLFGSSDNIQEDNSTTEENNENKEDNQEEITENLSAEDLFEGSESVGNEEGNNNKPEETPSKSEDGSSPNIYSSIAKALQEDGVFYGLEEEVFENIKDAEGFASAIERQIQNRFDERQRRINEALDYNVEPSDIQRYEHALNFLGSIKDEHINNESEQGETLRKQLIYQDYINRGYSEERATREVEKSFNSGTDITDAIEAKKTMEQFYASSYNEIIENAKKQKEEYEAYLAEEHNKLKNSLLEDSQFTKELSIDKKIRQTAYENLSTPKYRDEKTGEMLTEIQKAQNEDRVGFLRGMALAYTMTNGFKDLSKLSNGVVKKQVNSKLKEIETKLQGQNFFPTGNLEYVTKEQNENSFLGKGIQLDL